MEEKYTPLGWLWEGLSIRENFRSAVWSRSNRSTVYIRELSLGASDFFSSKVPALSSVRALYGTAVFASAFLLFLIEPIAAKEILPALGGSSAVWITCLVFFQGMLVLGYLYAHWLGGESFAKGALKAAPSSIHMLLLALAVVVAVAQLGVHPNLNDASRHPVTAIFLDLAWTIGLPFLLLACTSPLLQLWFARREGRAVPYRFFGLSNAGSLLALLLYPVAVEPYLTLRPPEAGMVDRICGGCGASCCHRSREQASASGECGSSCGNSGGG